MASPDSLQMMNHRKFFFQLILLTLLTAVALAFLQIFEGFSSYGLLSFVSLVFFFSMTVAIYFAAMKAATSQDKNAFTRLIMLVSFVKMVLTAGLVIGYHQLAKPSNSLFLIPFFSTYVIFTVFETSVMSKLAKIKIR